MKTLDTHNYYVYILTNKKKEVLYTGVTNNLQIRLYQHQNPESYSLSFAYKYKCFYLIYYEVFQDINEALRREKQIKGYSRIKKQFLINSLNAEWKFLNNEF